MDEALTPPRNAESTFTLLLVEDDVWVRMDVGQRLRSAGLKVVEAVNGQNALELLRSSTRIDLVLTDLHMPGIDGAALVQEIRVRCPHMPIFMSSAQLPSFDIYQMLDGFFSKPLDVPAFATYLQQGTGRS